MRCGCRRNEGQYFLCNNSLKKEVTSGYIIFLNVGFFLQILLGPKGCFFFDGTHVTCLPAKLRSPWNCLGVISITDTLRFGIR